MSTASMRDGGTHGPESIVHGGGHEDAVLYGTGPIFHRPHVIITHWQFPSVIPTVFPFRPTRQSHCT